MTGEQREIKPTRPWLRELLLWGAWSISTALGWFVAWIVIMMMLAAFSMPDSDAARIYLDYSPWERLSGPLLTGAIAGAIPGLVMGLLWLVMRRNVRQAAVVLLIIVGASSFLCLVASAGGPQVEGGVVTLLRLGILGGILGGGFVGLYQFLILRGRRAAVKGWIPLTMAGWVSGCIVTLCAFTMHRGAQYINAWFAILATALPFVGGALVGLVQWPSLRRHVPRAGWWILANSVGWGAASWLSRSAFGPTADMASMLASGAVIGVVTGTALALLYHFAHITTGGKSDELV
jgi:hypothetical protein